MSTPLNRATTSALGLHAPIRVDAALWQRVEAALDNIGEVEAVMGDAGFEFVIGELSGSAARSARPSSRTLERVRVMRKLYRRDERERMAIRSAVDEQGCQKLLALCEMTFAGMPALDVMLEDEQFCRYLSVGVRDQMRMTTFLAEVRKVIRLWLAGRRAA